MVTIPLAPRTARAIDLAIGERTEGPIFLAADGRLLDRHGAGRIVRRVARRAGIIKPVGPHTLRHAFITAAVWMLGFRCGMCSTPPTLIRAPRRGMTVPGPHWTGTPLTLLPPTSPEPPGKTPASRHGGRLAPTLISPTVTSMPLASRLRGCRCPSSGWRLRPAHDDLRAVAGHRRAHPADPAPEFLVQTTGEHTRLLLARRPGYSPGWLGPVCPGIISGRAGHTSARPCGGTA